MDDLEVCSCIASTTKLGDTVCQSAGLIFPTFCELVLTAGLDSACGVRGASLSFSPFAWLDANLLLRHLCSTEDANGDCRTWSSEQAVNNLGPVKSSVSPLIISDGAGAGGSLLTRRVSVIWRSFLMLALQTMVTALQPLYSRVHASPLILIEGSCTICDVLCTIGMSFGTPCKIGPSLVGCRRICIPIFFSALLTAQIQLSGL